MWNTLAYSVPVPMDSGHFMCFRDAISLGEFRLDRGHLGGGGHIARSSGQFS